VATAEIAPADKRLYRLRDHTATVESLPLITGSILSKKLASGAETLVFDVKTGNGAFMSELGQARDLAELLVGVTRSMSRQASALITDMSQPLGDWIGHAAEVKEALACLEGEGAEDLMEVTFALAEELVGANGSRTTRSDLEAVISSGRARERFVRWAGLQKAARNWETHEALHLAPQEVVLESPRAGRLNRVDTRRIGMLMVTAGAGRSRLGETIDHGVSMRYSSRLGDPVERGQELARLYLREPNESLVREFRACFVIGDEGSAPPRIVERVAAGSAA
jgi:thymidine phosphorylase